MPIPILMLLAFIGCDHRWMDPRWRSLGRMGVATVPGEFHSATFLDGETDEEFAAAVPNLKRVKIRQLNLQHTQLTDKSIDGLLQLRDVERLYLTRTDFRIDGLVRLASLPRLKMVYLPTGQFSAEELGRLRAALPNAVVEDGYLGSNRYSSNEGPHNPPMQRTGGDGKL